MVMSHQKAAVSRVIQCEADENIQGLQRQMECCLKSDPLLMASGIVCECREGVVVLRGQVRSFHEKQIAQERARQVNGVRMIVNRLAVQPSPLTRTVNELTAIRQPSVTPSNEISIPV